MIKLPDSSLYMLFICENKDPSFIFKLTYISPISFNRKNKTHELMQLISIQVSFAALDKKKTWNNAINLYTSWLYYAGKGGQAWTIIHPNKSGYSDPQIREVHPKKSS